MPVSSDPSAPRVRLITATTEIVGAEGLSGFDLDEVCALADVSAPAFLTLFEDASALLAATTSDLCGVAVFPAPEPGRSAQTTAPVLHHLASCHRAYVARWPARFSAIVHLSAAAVLGHDELLRPLAARQADARRTVATHLWPLRTAGAIAASRDISAISSAFVDTLVGIELCHLIDGSDSGREAAYREVPHVFAADL